VEQRGTELESPRSLGYLEDAIDLVEWEVPARTVVGGRHRAELATVGVVQHRERTARGRRVGRSWRDVESRSDRPPRRITRRTAP
jgi:hypothetical protein